MTRRGEAERDDDRDPEAQQGEAAHRDRGVARDDDEQAAEHGQRTARPHGAHRAEPVHHGVPTSRASAMVSMKPVVDAAASPAEVPSSSLR